MSDTGDIEAAKLYSVVLENGICLFTYYNELTSESILASQDEGINLMERQKIQLAPMIIDLSRIDESKNKLKIQDLSKVIASHKIVNFTSGLWFVGATGRLGSIISATNRFFLGGKIHISESLQQSKDEAAKQSSSDRPLLEQ